MNRVLTLLLKLAVSLSLLVYLVTRVENDDPGAFARMVTGVDDWGWFAAAWLCCSSALLLGVVRWRLLVRTLGIPLPMRDALRVGTLAFAADYAAVGAAGGDVFKAVLLVRERPGCRAEAVASVVADRIVGLFVLFGVTSVAVSFLDLSALGPEVAWLAAAVRIATATAGLGAAALLVPRRLPDPLIRALCAVPWVGGFAEQTLAALRMYRHAPTALLGAVALSAVVQALHATSVFLIACGLPGAGPTFAEHFLIVPMALVSGVVPLPFEALGVLDYAMSFLYVHVSAAEVAASKGLLVAFTYRFAGIAVTALGLAIYWSSRRGADATTGVRAVETEA